MLNVPTMSYPRRAASSAPLTAATKVAPASKSGGGWNAFKSVARDP